MRRFARELGFVSVCIAADQDIEVLDHIGPIRPGAEYGGALKTVEPQAFIGGSATHGWMADDLAGDVHQDGGMLIATEEREPRGDVGKDLALVGDHAAEIEHGEDVRELRA